MLEINLQSFKTRFIEVKNRELMPNLSNMRCCHVFFPSRFETVPHEGDPSVLSYKKLANQINWGIA